MSGFQGVVQQYPAYAVAGDFAGANPRASVPSPQGQFKAGNPGCTIGRFAWSDANGNLLNTGSGAPLGFVHRHNQALITAWLGAASMLIPQGYNMALMSAGDFYIDNPNGLAAAIGNKVFAKLTDGSPAFGAAGASITGYVETNFYVSSVGTTTVTDLIIISTYAGGHA